MDVGLRLVLDHLVDEGKDVVTLHTQQDERRSGIAVSGGVSAGHTAWVDEVLAVVLSDAVLVCVATDQDVAVKLPLNRGECLHVAPRDHLMSVDNSDLKVVDLHYLRLWQACNLVAVSLDDVCLTFCGSEILKPLDSLVVKMEE